MATQRPNQDFSYDKTPAASAIDLYDFKNDPTLLATATDKYLPFKNVYIFNTGTTDLTFQFNQRQQSRTVPAGTIMAVTNIDLVFAKVTNKSASTAGAYTILFNNDLSQEEIMQKLAEKLGVFV